ncbi:MAG TPA: methylmalonyl-CoA epimerase [Bdellovibrionales bacterium]|nr:methylmalonyl-CoA epimerase [Bdellovibrionales bacterium]
MKMTFELDHIAVAVESLEKGKTFYEALGLGAMTTETVASEGVNVGFFELDNDARIELLEPMSAESPVGKFLAKRGPGIHHICLKVKDVRATVAALKAQGVQMINDEPRPGAHGCLVAFVHPKSTGGVLLELSQHPEEVRRRSK